MRHLGFLRQRAVYVVALAVLGALFLGVSSAQATNGRIIIQKQTDPDGDPTVFSFTGTGGGQTLQFSLSDGQQQEAKVPAGTYAVVESPTDGWTLTSATCSDGSPTSAIELGVGEVITCVFTNTKNPP